MKCDKCDYETDNGKIMSNHKRWKHSEISFSNEARNNIQFFKKTENITKTCICQKCGKSFILTLKLGQWNKKNKHGFYCSRSCANSRIKQKKEKRICEICHNEFIYSKTNQKTCSISCGLKLFHANKQINFISEYRRKCQFDFALSDYPDEFNFSLIEEYGWYKAKNRGNNLNGISRDHMVSVKYGWENNISPEIISHPANCKLLQHGSNAKKYSSCSITYNELLERIDEWNKKYGRLA